MIGEDLSALLDAAAYYNFTTGGAFNIAIAPAASAWGFTKDHFQVPSQEEIDELLKLVDGFTLREEPEGVEFEGFGELYASYACPISDQQELRVEVRFPDMLDLDSYEIVCWRAVPVGQWENDENLNVWDGEGTLF